MEIHVITCLMGIACLVLTHSCSASTLKNTHVQRFQDNDQRTRNKRNVSDTENAITTSKTVTQRKELTNVKEKTPTVCFNNITLTENGESLNNFTCPRANQSSGLVHCCGKVPAQKCCSKDEYERINKAKVKESTGDPVMRDFNIVTGISIAAGFVASILICLFFYCCCCQRRHEIHDGVKLMWVRRSFGKELNRLEQNQDQMTVVNSITGIRESRRCSRQGSRHGSRQPSRQGSLRSNARSRPGSFNRGSRNPSAVPTPSISRRASHDQSSHHHKGHSTERHHLGVDVPSNVVITVTTPSDEHGPTAPLLKTAQHENAEVES